MDPFEVRMQFLTLLRRLTASQQSIQRVVSYALKYFSRCGEDLWDCIVEECQNGTINTRINILYFLDSLCEASLLSKATTNSANTLYINFVTRDLEKIVEYVVPEGREGLINLMSTIQILDNWRTKRVLDHTVVEQVLTKLDAQKETMHTLISPSTSPAEKAESVESNMDFDRNEVFKRIEEDRERHKRLRERRWVQPIGVASSSAMTQLASFAPNPDDVTTSVTSASNHNASQEGGVSPVVGEESALDIEFENEWETTSDWNEDDEEAVAEENTLCYPNASVRLSLPASRVDMDTR